MDWKLISLKSGSSLSEYGKLTIIPSFRCNVFRYALVWPSCDFVIEVCALSSTTNLLSKMKS